MSSVRWRAAATLESQYVTQFIDLGLAAPLMKALEDEGYHTPTPIQIRAIPPLMTGVDLLGIAQTGTGKTAAFALPILHRLAADPKPAPRKGARVLVLSPTRELASQIAQSFITYGRHMKVKVAVVFGGVAHRPQMQALAGGLDILVATPGRLLDHMGERNCDLSQTEVLVLDEADQMLDLGFIRPIRQIVAAMPAKRQNLLFSATMPKEIAGLADSLLKNPVKVAVTPVGTTVERVKQRVIHCDTQRKRALLAELLSSADLTRALVFTRTKRGADRVAKHLEGCNITVAAIHGNKSQRQREIALDEFKTGKIRVLVATDIAARGIDVDSVSHVVNYELPEVAEVYVHRIGRTGRAGATGLAISLCDSEERDLLRDIERLTRQTIPSEDRRGDLTLAADKAGSGAREERGDRRSGGQGRRDSRPAPSRSGRSGGGDAGRSRNFADRGERPAQSRDSDRGNSGHGNSGSNRDTRGSGHGVESGASLARVGFMASPGQRTGGGGSHRNGAPERSEGGRPRSGGGGRSDQGRSNSGTGDRGRNNRGPGGRSRSGREQSPA